MAGSLRLNLAALAIVLVCGMAAPAIAGEADVVDVKVTAQNGTFRFDVTVRHDDEGWDHYADKWEVVGADGAVYGERVLLHPHENERPFTRSQSGIVVPEEVSEVIVRAHDKVHGFGGREMVVTLPGR
ncbi:MAG: hypothetical protein LJE67_14595 [Salaquimonas sp.]|jgi:hypothetical protein|nr:hypothetical protein [Salaquimonas sp.]